MYFAGQTDEVKGTGVFREFEMKREPRDGEEEDEGGGGEGE